MAFFEGQALLRTWLAAAAVCMLAPRCAAAAPAYDKVVLSLGLNTPVDVEALPDGRLLLVQLDGQVWIFNPPSGAIKSYVKLAPRVSGESGLLDVALGPEWSQSGTEDRFVYLYVEQDFKMRIVRLKHLERKGGASSRADVDSMVLLWTDIDTTTRYIPKHYGGQITFGPDGYLYLTQGNCPRHASNRSTPRPLGRSRCKSSLSVTWEPLLSLYFNPHRSPTAVQVTSGTKMRRSLSLTS